MNKLSAFWMRWQLYMQPSQSATASHRYEQSAFAVLIGGRRAARQMQWPLLTLFYSMYPFHYFASAWPKFQWKERGEEWPSVGYNFLFATPMHFTQTKISRVYCNTSDINLLAHMSTIKSGHYIMPAMAAKGQCNACTSFRQKQSK